MDQFKARERRFLDELNNILASKESVSCNMRRTISFPFKTDINELLILFLENARDQEDLERLRAVGNHIKDIADYQSHIIDNVLDEELWENFFGLLVSSWAASKCLILTSSVVQDSERYERGTGAYQAFSLEYSSVMSMLHELCESVIFPRRLPCSSINDKS